MASNSTREQQALAQVMRADEEEAHREYWWRLMPSVDRQRALGLANLDRSRADNPLSSFSVQERESMYGALLGHIGRMEILKMCTGILIERRPVVDQVGALSRLAELEQQQELTQRRRQELARLQQQELEQGTGTAKPSARERRALQRQQDQQADAIDAGRVLH